MKSGSTRNIIVLVWLINEVGVIAKDYGKKDMVATYARGRLDPIIDKVESSLKAAGIEFVIFTGI